jgi:hypothetical protein
MEQNRFGPVIVGAPLMAASDAALMPHVLEHYQLTAPLIEASFSGVPLIYRNYPNGIGTPGAFHFTCVPLSVNKLLWLIHAKYAIEFYTWAPLAARGAARRRVRASEAGGTGNSRAAF